MLVLVLMLLVPMVLMPMVLVMVLMVLVMVLMVLVYLPLSWSRSPFLNQRMLTFSLSILLSEKKNIVMVMHS